MHDTEPNTSASADLIYWDHCATTPTSPRVIEAMTSALSEHFANPSSAHRWGGRARDLVEDARIELASLLNASPRELFWTSGATEANNLALFGVAESADEPIHIISQVTEHSAVLKPLKVLEGRGHEVTLLDVDERGLISVDALRAALRPNTRLVSLMLVNNEIGARQPVREVGELLREVAPQCLLHADGAQAVGKIEIDLKSLPIDLLSLSAHKFYGPKGAGALYIRRGATDRGALEVAPLLCGGSQERGVRPGTLATHQIVGLGVAASEVRRAFEAGEPARLRALNERLYAGLKRFDPDAKRRSTPEGSPHVLSVTLSLRSLILLEARWGHVAFSQGSACHSSSGGPSHVLSAIGVSAEEAGRTLRFGLGHSTSEREIDLALSLLEG